MALSVMDSSPTFCKFCCCQSKTDCHHSHCSSILQQLIALCYGTLKPFEVNLVKLLVSTFLHKVILDLSATQYIKTGNIYTLCRSAE